jgi:hypothetical protein
VATRRVADEAVSPWGGLPIRAVQVPVRSTDWLLMVPALVIAAAMAVPAVTVVTDRVICTLAGGFRATFPGNGMRATRSLLLREGPYRARLPKSSLQRMLTAYLRMTASALPPADPS